MQCKTADELKKLMPNYYWQIQHGLFVTDFKVWEFCSYDPRMPENLMFYRLVIERNDDDISLMRDRINEAILLKQEIIKQINER